MAGDHHHSCVPIPSARRRFSVSRVSDAVSARKKPPVLGTGSSHPSPLPMSKPCAACARYPRKSLTCAPGYQSARTRRYSHASCPSCDHGADCRDPWSHLQSARNLSWSCWEPWRPEHCRRLPAKWSRSLPISRATKAAMLPTGGALPAVIRCGTACDRTKKNSPG
jgi:hypothetical protein